VNVASFAECSYGDVSMASATFSCYRCLFLCSRLILHGPDFKSSDIDIVEWHYLPGCQCNESFWYSPQSRASFEAFATHVSEYQSLAFAVWAENANWWIFVVFIPCSV